MQILSNVLLIIFPLEQVDVVDCLKRFLTVNHNSIPDIMSL